jgi:hypothetical protein
VTCFLTSFALIFLTPYTLLFCVSTAMFFSLLFLFPISYPTRAEVSMSAKKPITLFSSPVFWLPVFIVMCILIFIMFAE